MRKGVLRIRIYQQETPHALQEANDQLLVPNRRGLLGFSGLAPHSGRSSVPFHRTCSGTEEFPSNQPSPHERDGLQQGGKYPWQNI